MQAGAEGFSAPRGSGRTGSDARAKTSGALHKAGAGQKAVFEAGANHLLEIGVVQVVGFDGANVFVRQVDARDAFVVGGERDRNAEFAVDREADDLCR